MPHLMNIVFVTIDALRYDALGIAPDHRALSRYGLDKLIHTPNLDRFAQEHVYFTQALSASASTTSSHASIMTGLYPPAHGVRAFFEQRLPPRVLTLAQVLREHGYSTVALHEAEDPVEPGTGLLFESGVGVLRGFDEVVRNGQELIRSQAVRSGRPVFAFLHLWDVHEPYLQSACEDIPDRYEPLQQKLVSLTERYSLTIPPLEDYRGHTLMPVVRMIEQAITDPITHNRELFTWYIEGVNWFDHYRWPILVETLKQAGLWDNTLLFVFGDHGEGPLEDQPVAGKRFGHGLVLVDDRLRVPLVVRGLPNAKPDQIHRQVSLVDLAPTVLEVLGIDPGSLNGNIDLLLRGVSLLTALKGRPRPNSWHFAESFDPEAKTGKQVLYQRAVRTERYKLVCHDGEVTMQRFRRWDNQLERFIRRVLGRVNVSWRNPRIDERELPERKLFWVDLRMDPDEYTLQRWSCSVPDEVREMRNALAQLYKNPTYGPQREVDEQTMLIQRLAALGYIEV